MRKMPRANNHTVNSTAPFTDNPPPPFGSVPGESGDAIGVGKLQLLPLNSLFDGLAVARAFEICCIVELESA